MIRIYTNKLNVTIHPSDSPIYAILLQDYSLNVFLRQTWRDPRLNFSHLSNISVLELDQRRIGDVWVPDTYFQNEKTASFHTVTVPNKLLHIHNDGFVIYSIRSDMRLCMAVLELNTKCIIIPPSPPPIFTVNYCVLNFL